MVLPRDTAAVIWIKEISQATSKLIEHYRIHALLPAHVTTGVLWSLSEPLGGQIGWPIRQCGSVPRCCLTSRYVGTCSACTLTKQHNLRRLEQNDQIEEQAMILGIIEIVLQLVHRVIDCRAVWIADLCPAGNARLYRVAV